MSTVGVCRSESLNVQLEVPPGQSSGLAVHEDNCVLVVSHMVLNSPAFRYDNPAELFTLTHQQQQD